MANKLYAYRPDAAAAADVVAITVEENIMSIYADVVWTKSALGADMAAAAPTAYADLAAFQAAFPGRPLKLASLNVRRLNINVPGFGAAVLPILDNHPAAEDEDVISGFTFNTTVAINALSDEATVLPVETLLTEPGATITGFAGESRLNT